MVDMKFDLSAVPTVMLGGFLLFLWGLYITYSWQKTSKSGARVPEGSTGMPIIGESLAFSVNPIAYYNERIKKYGRVFKTNLFLNPSIVGTTPEFAKLLFANPKLFKTGYPANIKNVLGQKGSMFLDGPQHMNIKKIMQKNLSLDCLKTQVLPFEDIILRHLNNWADKGSVLSSTACCQVAMDLGLFIVLGIPDLSATSEGAVALKKFSAIGKALYSLPINLPGFDFYKGMQASAWVGSYFKRLAAEREGKENLETDTMGVLLAARENVQLKAELKGLDDDAIVDNLNLMWYAASDNTATILLWAMKYLNDYPEIYEKVKGEQDDIINQKLAAGEDPSRLTWEDTKKMIYSSKFVLEVFRIISVPGIVIRKPIQDVDFQGKVIPKNWATTLMYMAVHQDPEIYPDPFKVDPSRFDTPPKPFTFLAFSGGPHMCPGSEVAKVTLLIFLHVLVTGFVFQSAAPDQGIVYNSFPSPKGGYPINIQRREGSVLG